MNADSEDLDYLTVDTIQWATGCVRPRMSREDKRAKHRVHQRNFMLRQRERLEELRRELRRHKLQVLRLQAAHEQAALAVENDSLRQQIISESLPTSRENGLGIWDVIQTEPVIRTDSLAPSPTGEETVPTAVGDSFIFELLTMLPEVKTEVVKSDASYWSPQCEAQDPTPLTWSPTTPCDLAGLSWSSSTAFEVVTSESCEGYHIMGGVEGLFTC
jgi:hypothetical protein